MNKTQTFEELDKLAEGLRGLDTEKLHDTPEHKKWKAAINTLPKEDRKKYYDKKYQESKYWLESQYPQSELIWSYSGEKMDMQKIERLNNTIKGNAVREDVETVFFAFKQAHKKQKDVLTFDYVNWNVQKNKEIQNLYYPETVPIDYSEYSHIPSFKYNIPIKSYKDGILLVGNDIHRKNEKILALTLGDSRKSNFSIGKVIASIYESKVYNYSQIDWFDKKFNEQIVFYIVVPKIAKNRAVRIVFKNNLRLNRLIKTFREHQTCPEIKVKEFKYFFDEAAESQYVITSLQICQDSPESKPQYIFNNSTLLKTGYTRALRQCWNIHLMCSEKYQQENLFFEMLKNKRSLEDIKKEYMRDIFPYEKYLDISLLTKDSSSKHVASLMKKNFLKASLLYHHANKGLTFCDGKNIETENKSKVDCLLFWKKIDVFELLFSPLNNNFPLCMEDSKIINEVDIFDPILNKHVDIVEDIFDKESYIHEYKDIKEFNFKDKHILQEAIDSQTGYLMPFDGAHEFLHDPNFIHVRFREYEDFIIIVLCEKNGRYLVDVFSKTEVDFKYMIWHNLKYDKDYSEQCLQEIYTKFATCIRDAKVLRYRTSSMQYQGRRKPYGSNTNEEYPIYFPRTKYIRDYSKEQKKREKDFFNESKKFSGSRCAHVRKLPSGNKPSKKQLLLAKQLDRWVPENHTFVSATKWGQNITKRERKYRNTALNGILYYNNKEISEAVKIDKLCPAQFEEYCEEYVKKLGYEVKTRNNYDGGIDIRAVKILDNEEAEYLLVQCKHWNTPIPPGAVRDFKAGSDEEKTKDKKVLMFITSSKFSPGAREYASKHNIILIDGDKLLGA